MLTSETAAALRLAHVSTSRLNSVVRQEILAGRWSLDESRRPSAPSPELSTALSEIDGLWQHALSTTTAEVEGLTTRASILLDEYEHAFTRMTGGEKPVMSPFSLPHNTYVGAELTEPMPVPRWLGQLAVLPDKPWGHLPWTDLADRNLIFLPDDQNLGYGDSVAAVQSIVADQMSRSAPNGLKITWIDGMHQGRSAGAFQRLIDVGPLVLSGRVWTAPQEIETALQRVANRADGIQQSCLKNDLPHLDAYNAQPGVPTEAHHLVVVTGYPNGFQPESARLLRQVTQQGYRTGISVLVVMHPMMASIAPSTDCAVPYYATMTDGTLPDSAPEWCTFDVLPIGEPVLGRAGHPHARVFPYEEDAPVWMPYVPRHVDTADQEAILLGYVRSSAHLVATGLSPRELTERNLKPAERTNALRKAMLTWLREQSGHNRVPRWEDFLTSEPARLTGATFTADEVDKQAATFQDSGFVLGASGPNSPTPVLTRAGEDLAEREHLTAADFTAAKQGDTITTIFQRDVSGSLVAVGKHNTVVQHRHQGYQKQLEDLIAALNVIVDRLPQILSPGPDAEDSLAHAADALTEATAPQPDEGKLRRAVKGLAGLLKPVADQAVQGAGEGAHELAKEALTHLQPFVS
ncbi:hypothetical protein [Lentzea sp. NPDC059081]|uniref:hypothetical protein n=1 Tax=Lentzea sp. NPDC059081 TaxID=3346719 RepID=UPI0036963CD3